MFRLRSCERAVPSAGVECVLGLPRATFLSHGRHSAVIRTQQLPQLALCWFVPDCYRVNPPRSTPTRPMHTSNSRFLVVSFAC